MQTFISFASDMKLSCDSTTRTKISFSQSLLSGYIISQASALKEVMVYTKSLLQLSTIVSNLDYQGTRCKTKICPLQQS